MSLKILVAYASVSGSTREVAEAIAEVLRETNDALVDVQAVRDVADIDMYDAIVVGSSIRAGRWLPEAFQFLENWREEMDDMPVAYFTTCLTMVDDSESNRRVVLAYMEPVRQKTPNITPIGLGLFAGSLDPQRSAMMQARYMPQGDYRNWDAIRAWATEIGRLIPEFVQAAQAEPPILELNEAVLSFTDLSGTDLSQAHLFKADLRQSNLSETKLHDADLSETKLVKADLHRADLQHAALNWADLQASDLSSANLSRANMIGAHLSRADLSGADLSWAILNGANLSNANLRGANLSHADLNWVDFRGADLREANLSAARLGWANLIGTDLNQANFNQAYYNEATTWPEGFSPDEQDSMVKLSEPN